MTLNAQAQPAQQSDPSPSKEMKIYAAYISHFIQLIDWPRKTNHSNTIIFCTDAATSFIDFFQQLQLSKNAHSHEITISNSIAYPDCNLVFLTRPTIQMLPPSRTRIIISINYQQVHPNTLITFSKKANTIQYEINITELQKLDISLPAEILRLAGSIKR
ncbi:YfiR family protein [Aestuariibacter sp. AA17]|uniref:YfiR family protein n=1 Tax=Fluctibacter corallii TaxID=2984329 RepID=A0ABT3A524_9ALTE|nr:YfiR family protein [Aestuariibacter sp. AA17]MCV2883471.1 YfiR family protein [Aestuariibacter sp. AA17]